MENNKTEPIKTDFTPILSERLKGGYSKKMWNRIKNDVVALDKLEKRLLEEYISKCFHKGLSLDDDENLPMFNEYNSIWEKEARRVIRNLNIEKPERRSALINKFADVIHKTSEQFKKPIDNLMDEKKQSSLDVN